MRVALFAVLAAVVAGCGKKDEPAVPNVKLQEPEPAPGADPGPGPGVNPAPAKSLAKLEFAKLWAEHGAAEKVPDPETQLARHTGLLWYSANDLPYFAAELAGGANGPGGAVVAALRHEAQDGVKKRVEAATKEPLVIRSGVGGLKMEMSSSGGGSARRTAVIGVEGSREQVKEGMERYAAALVKLVATDPAYGPATATAEGEGTSRRIAYTTPDRRGTILLDVLFGDAVPEEVDKLLPPNDPDTGLIRTVRDDKATLLIVRLTENSR